MTTVNGFNGGDKNISKGSQPRTEIEQEKFNGGQVTKTSIFMKSQNGKEYMAETVISYDYNNDGKVDKIYKSKYDENERIIEEAIDSNGDGKDDTKEYRKYDNKGNLLEYAQDYNADGKIDYQQNYKYDNNGITEEAQFYDDNGEVVDKATRKYDKQGNPIEEIWEYNGSGKNGKLLK